MGSGGYEWVDWSLFIFGGTVLRFVEWTFPRNGEKSSENDGLKVTGLLRICRVFGEGGNRERSNDTSTENENNANSNEKKEKIFGED